MDETIKKGRYLLGRIERANQRMVQISGSGPGAGVTARIHELAQRNADDLTALHALLADAVGQHGAGAGASPDVVAAVVAPKDPVPDGQ